MRFASACATAATRAGRRSRPCCRRSASRSSRRRSATTCITLWPFFLAGLLAPGASQILFTLGVREIGASRTSVTVGAAPLVAVAIALVFLGEPLRVPLVIGALAVVAGGVLLAAERGRPGHLRGAGPALCRGGRGALRDARQHRPLAPRACHARRRPPLRRSWPARASQRSGRDGPPTKRELKRLAPAGVLFGLSYICLFEAYWRGRVTVVSPLVATESLWGVVLAALLIRHTEGMGRRLAFGALLIVAGGALIGATR